jgi:phosphoglycerate dehydrogenase-like enzyme
MPVDALETRGMSLGVATSPALISVAEHAVMLILAVFKRLGVAIDRTRQGKVAPGVSPRLTNQEEYSYNWVGLEKFEAVHGKTIGLVGLGRIGREVASMLKAFDCDVVYTKRNRLSPGEEADLGVRYVEFDELLKVSDCVSLHNRFTEETETMMGEKEFASMPRGSFFVNTARGRLVDEFALCDALESGQLGGAALDVFWYEPPKDDSRLWEAPNLIMTPHTAGIPIAVSLEQELAQAAQFISSDWDHHLSD